MRASVRIVYNRKKTGSATKAASVELCVTAGGKRKYISTGVRVRTKEWLNKNNVFVYNRHDADVLNKELWEQLQRVQNICLKAGNSFNFALLDSRQYKESFLEYMALKIEERTDIVESTKVTHRTALNGLTEFGRIQSFSDLTEQNFRAFDEWLRKAGRQQITIWGYHKRIKPYIHMAMHDGFIDRYPYEYITVSRGHRKVRKYLTDEQLQTFAKAKMPNSHLEQARDLFIFQAYTGLAYSDMARFDFKQSVEKRTVRGSVKYYYIDQRVKTQESFYLQILPPAMAVLKRYKYKLPIISNQKYNDYLKAAAGIAGINKGITSHWARHTFAVWALNNDIPMEVVQKMLGHANIEATKIYAEIVQKRVDDAFEDLTLLTEDSVSCDAMSKKKKKPVRKK